MNAPQPDALQPAKTSMYVPQRAPRALHVPVRDIEAHVLVWGEPALVTPERPPLWLAHGWMDVADSFQFLVDELAAVEGPTRYVLAMDWRGFGRTQAPATDTYWFADYLADLDALARAPELGLTDDLPFDLVGHSMGGNIVLAYAGVRPGRIRRLVNIEGYGVSATEPRQAPRQLARWLLELQQTQRLADYDGADGVQARLQRNNPRITPGRAAWLARRWAQADASGRWNILGDPAHKRVSALRYNVEDALAMWEAIEAPVLMVEGADTRVFEHWQGRYTREEFLQREKAIRRLARRVLPDCGHMVHHDQPELLARLVQAFLTA